MSAIYDDLRRDEATQNGSYADKTAGATGQGSRPDGAKETAHRWSGLDGVKEVGRKWSSRDDSTRRSSAQSSASRMSSIRKRFSSRSGSGRRSVKRIVFLGACEVGKTAIVSRMRGVEYFSNVYEPTLIDYIPHSMALKTTEPEPVELVDVTGAMEKEYEPVREKAMKKADAFAVIFSVKTRNSFIRAEAILDQIESLVGGKTAEEGFRVLLVGNQVDEDDEELEEYDIMPVERVVTPEEGWQLADKFGIKDYLEMSALTGIGVDSIPRRLAAMFQGLEDKSKPVKKSRSFMGMMADLGRKLTRSPSAAAEVRNGKRSSSGDTSSRTNNTLSSTGREGSLPSSPHTLVPEERARSGSWVANLRRSFRSKKKKRAPADGGQEELNDSPPRRRQPVVQTRRPSMVTTV